MMRRLFTEDGLILFNAFLKDNFYCIDLSDEYWAYNEVAFNDLPKSMQMGLIYEFADGLGYDIIIRQEHYLNGINWLWQILKFENAEKVKGMCTGLYGDNAEYDTRIEAFEASVAQLNEFLNGRKGVVKEMIDGWK